MTIALIQLLELSLQLGVVDASARALRDVIRTD
jgi:hypothetical protein